MSNLAFDTYAQVKQLVQTGVPEAQAEAFVNVVAGATTLPDVSQLATKADLAVVKSEIALVEANLKSEIALVEANLKSEIAVVEANLKGEIKGVQGDVKGLQGEIKGLQGEMKGLEGRLVWWIIGCFGLNAIIGLGAAIPQILAHLPK